MTNLTTQQRLDAMNNGKLLMLPQNYHSEAFFYRDGVIVSKMTNSPCHTVDLNLITDCGVLAWAIDPTEFEEHCELAREMYFDELDEDTQDMVDNGTGRFDLSTPALF